MTVTPLEWVLGRDTYTPKKNGKVEWKLWHIMETKLALLTTTSLALKFLVYVFQTTETLINCMPTPLLDYKSPFHILLNRISNYYSFHIFGCLCYPYLWPYNSHKLHLWSTPCIFIGYNSSHKGYICLNLLTESISITS